MNALQTILAIGTGGALGAVARYGTVRTMMALLGPNFPYGTLAVNIIGSLVMGMAVAWADRMPGDATFFRTFFMIGLLGAFTTFSAYSLDVHTLFRERSLSIAGIYMMTSIFFSVAALIAGLAIGKRFL